MRKNSTLKFIVNTYHPKQGKFASSEYKEQNKDNTFQAPDYCVENILNFARSYRVADSKSTGKVEMVLN